MEFKKVDVDMAIAEISEQFVKTLGECRSVLWLASGGSNIRTQAEILNNLRKFCPELLDRLVILPMDERFGSSGHRDSNSAQLNEAGFGAGDERLVDILSDNLPFEVTITAFQENYIEESSKAERIIGTFGMGADGHVAGVLPESPAIEDSEVTVIGYTAGDYIRMTLSPAELTKCDLAYLICYGSAKSKALHTLKERSLPLSRQPAVLLYDTPQCIIYNDQVE